MMAGGHADCSLWVDVEEDLAAGAGRFAEGAVGVGEGLERIAAIIEEPDPST